MYTYMNKYIGLVPNPYPKRPYRVFCLFYARLIKEIFPVYFPVLNYRNQSKAIQLCKSFISFEMYILAFSDLYIEIKSTQMIK